jgi:hypothetical protein
VISLIATALHATRAVTNHYIELRRLPACFLAFSRPEEISLKATAIYATGQSMNAEQNENDRHHHSAKEAAAP